jgi:hypothetical protein
MAIDLTKAFYTRRRHGRVYALLWRDRAKLAPIVAERGRCISWSVIAAELSTELGKTISAETARRTWSRVQADMAEGVDARYQEQPPHVESVLPEPETPRSEYQSLSEKLAEVAETPAPALVLPPPSVIRAGFERARLLQQKAAALCTEPLPVETPPPIEAEVVADQPGERGTAESFWGKLAGRGAAGSAETQAMWKRRREARTT